MLNLQEIKLNDKGQIQETFSTNNPRIKSVTFTYLGDENNLNKILESMIMNYGKNEKLIA